MAIKPIHVYIPEIVDALFNAPGHELTRNKLILRFYGRYDISTHELDRAINMLERSLHMIKWTGQGYRLSDEYMSSDEYKERLSDAKTNSR